MNLICITESELSQWVSRRYLDTLTARVLTDCECLTTAIFITLPYLRIDDARGRIVVNLKNNWQRFIYSVDTSKDRSVNVASIPLDAILEIAPMMEQYKKRLATYKLPIAEWSVEKVWDKWLINQAVMETQRAIFQETIKIGFFDTDFFHNENLIRDLIEKSLRPNAATSNASTLLGWANVFEKRDTWIQWLRVEGHLDNLSMLRASAQKISNDLYLKDHNFNFVLQNVDRGWRIQDITSEIMQEFFEYDSENLQSFSTLTPPLFCVVVYLRLYDEIHNGNKDWRDIFNLLRFTKNTVNSLHTDLLTVALLASLKAEEIYSLRLRDLYMS